MSGYSALESLLELEKLLANRKQTNSLPTRSLDLLYGPAIEAKRKEPVLRMSQAAKHAVKAEKRCNDKDGVVNRVIDKNFQFRTLHKDFETSLGLELLIESVYSKSTVLRCKDNSVQKFTCQTAVLNLLLSISKSVNECRKVPIANLPYALHMTNKHLAKRNTHNKERFVVQSKDIDMPRDIDERRDHPPLGHANSDRARISRS